MFKMLFCGHIMILKRFIVFEGIDGSGTTTQLKMLSELCKEKSIKIFSTCEPTTSGIGKVIEQFLSKNEQFATQTIVRLFACDRSEHIYGKNGILEALNEGALVVCDRYLFSSLAYQGFGNTKELVKKENEDFPLPEVLFLFCLSAEKAMKRIEKRKEKKEIYEKVQFLDGVSKNYLNIIEEYKRIAPDMKIVMVNAEKTEKEVFSFIKDQLEKMKII